MLHEREILTSQQMQEFSICFSAFVEGAVLPEEYLRQGRVFGLFDEERLRGGYVIITRPPFRGLSAIPEDRIAMLLDRFSIEDTFEVNGFWVEPELSRSATLRQWLRVCMRIGFSGKKHYLCWFDLNNKYFMQVYGRAKLKVLYAGPENDLSGHNEGNKRNIFVGLTRPRWVMWAFLVGATHYLSKIVLRKKRNHAPRSETTKWKKAS